MRIVSIALLMLASAATSSIAAAQSKLDFTLKNSTGLTIQEVYVSPDESDDWEEDVLGRDVLKNGESVEIEFARSEKSCDWDLKIKDADGNEVEWDSLDLCVAVTIELEYKGKKATARIIK